MRNNWLIDRRTCLRGLGVALALPLLETMGWADPVAGAKVKPPVRLGFMYMPHGVIPEQFWPKDPATYLSAPPPILEPLRPVLDQCLVVKGITGVPIAPLNGAPHALELSTWLTATLPDSNKRNVVNIAISADQIAANYVGVFTSLPSLELATMPQTHKENQEGLNETYYSHCSYRSPTQPVPAETNPRSVFKRLFQTRDQGQSAGKGSALGDADSLDHQMLDLVLGGAKDLRGKLGHSDQHKLDEYLDGVRALERRITAIELRRNQAEKAAGSGGPQRGANDSAPITVAIPEGETKRSEYMQVMCDLTVLAFQSDITRVSTYIGSTPNGVSYPELGFTDEHHSQTHHNNEAVKVDKVAKINAFNVAQFAYMVKKMASLREGDGTLLDNCIMMWGTGLEDGNKHTRANLPFVVAGRGGGSLKTGRYLPNSSGNQGDLMGTLLTAAGIPLDRPIGIGTKVLSEMLTA
jgi:Protein of unknown function (DUF1552)